MRRLAASAAEETYPGRTEKKKKKVSFPRTCEVDGLLREARLRSGGFPMERTTVYTGEMSTAPGPTVASQLTSEQIIVVVASCE